MTRPDTHASPARLPRVLWVVDLDYRSGIRHGASLRFLNLSRELVAAGHEVYYAVSRKEADDAAEKTRYLDGLKAGGYFTDYFETSYRHPRGRGKLARLLVHPALVNRALRASQAETAGALRTFVREKGIDLCVFADRGSLYALPAVRGRATTVVDWIDSYALFWAREITAALRARRFARLPPLARHMADALLQEGHYGRLCDLNLVVSPVDKRALDRVNRSPRRNRVLLNGVALPEAEAAPPAKVGDRLIFSGNMDFPPNYQAALWFLDKVFPLVAARRPGVEFVVAGANPVAELRARAGAGVVVTGMVEDLRREIARSRLYVAPLVTGGGFKNKIAEAVTSGTFVVSTTLGVEFLDESIRRQLLVADAPEEMARKILDYLDAPDDYDVRLAPLAETFREQFRWKTRAEELLALAACAPARGDERAPRPEGVSAAPSSA